MERQVGLGWGEDVDKRRNELSGEWVGKQSLQWGGRSGWRSYLGCSQNNSWNKTTLPGHRGQRNIKELQLLKSKVVGEARFLGC